MIKRILLLTIALTYSPLPDFIAPPATHAQQPSDWQQFFQRVVSRSPLPRKRGGGRTGLGWEVISPGVWSPELWAMQPRFIWRVRPNAKFVPDRVEILQMGANSPLWSQPLQRNSSRTIVISAKLEPGRTYWVRFLSRNADLQKDEVVIAWEFKTLSIAQRQTITKELDQINPTLKPVDFLQRRIEVFAKYGLWSDAFEDIDRSILSASDRQRMTDQLLTQLKTATPSRTRK